MYALVILLILLSVYDIRSYCCGTRANKERILALLDSPFTSIVSVLNAGLVLEYMQLSQTELSRQTSLEEVPLYMVFFLNTSLSVGSHNIDAVLYLTVMHSRVHAIKNCARISIIEL